ncbi:MAG: hypothetical protein RR975_15560 [Clostridia bacterium]
MECITKLKDALHLRMYGNPDDYFEESVWKAKVDAICADLPAAIGFILSECTDEEFLWLSEIFDDVMDKTRSAEFLQALRERADRVDNPEWKAEILEDIRTASEYINET